MTRKRSRLNFLEKSTAHWSTSFSSSAEYFSVPTSFGYNSRRNILKRDLVKTTLVNHVKFPFRFLILWYIFTIIDDCRTRVHAFNAQQSCIPSLSPSFHHRHGNSFGWVGIVPDNDRTSSLFFKSFHLFKTKRGHELRELRASERSDVVSSVSRRSATLTAIPSPFYNNGARATNDTVSFPSFLSHQDESEMRNNTEYPFLTNLNFIEDNSFDEFNFADMDVPRPTENGGYSHTAESKAKISAANKGKTPWNKGLNRSEEVKARISAGVRARNRDRFLQKLQDMQLTEEEYYEQKRQEKRKREAERRARRTAKGGYRPTEETKRKISRVLKEKYATGDMKKRIVDAAKIRRGFTHSEETRAKISESLRKRWATDPAYRALMKDKTVQSNTDESVRRKISETLRRKWQDPTFRAEMIAKISVRKRSTGIIDDEHRQKISAAMRAKWQDESYRQKIIQSMATTRKDSVKKLQNNTLTLESMLKFPKTNVKKSSVSAKVPAALGVVNGKPKSTPAVAKTKMEFGLGNYDDHISINGASKEMMSVAAFLPQSNRLARSSESLTGTVPKLVRPLTKPKPKVRQRVQAAKVLLNNNGSPLPDDVALDLKVPVSTISTEQLERTTASVMPSMSDPTWLNDSDDDGIDDENMLIKLQQNNLPGNTNSIGDASKIDDTFKTDKKRKQVVNGSVDLLREQRRDLYDLLYGDGDELTVMSSSFPFDDDNLDDFDPYGLENF